ncbi:hypothetical protein ACFQU7_12445 [Pseudoroseomonas wenyumeiae]
MGGLRLFHLVRVGIDPEHPGSLKALVKRPVPQPRSSTRWPGTSATMSRSSRTTSCWRSRPSTLPAAAGFGAGCAGAETGGSSGSARGGSGCTGSTTGAGAEASGSGSGSAGAATASRFGSTFSSALAWFESLTSLIAKPGSRAKTTKTSLAKTGTDQEVRSRMNSVSSFPTMPLWITTQA